MLDFTQQLLQVGSVVAVILMISFLIFLIIFSDISDDFTDILNTFPDIPDHFTDIPGNFPDQGGSVVAVIFLICIALIAVNLSFQTRAVESESLKKSKLKV